MKRAFVLTAAAVAALSLAACNKAENTADNAGDAAANMNPGQTQPVNAAQDAVGAAVGQVSASTMGANATGPFVTNAAMGNMYEIEAGRMAQERAQSADVKAFGKMMVTDHTALTNEMKPLIQAAGQTAPAELDQRRKGMLDNLRAASGADFDRVYLTQQVAAHEETLTLMQGYAQNGDDAGLKGAAAKAAPKVQAHLERARALQGGASGGGMH
ncbi:DUF4142 domain-containing protein [Phenylobacterium deserti]|uniref:DUF4142 domain-containing protein n=1 Tax=Phenylobacterium deserti TaxID=1914756 RepID=A0A328APE2_9CAUL|nr:DUF4142 domain-containing protein [Phenylobacterium deserti]RAK56449.1 DUF4142 domain-containing protein [Phenylobacterium deserti]